MSAWRDIKTAPEGTHLVCRFVGKLGRPDQVHPIYAIAWLGTEGWRTPEGWRVNPTHWMPLPDPPTADRLPRAEDGTPIHPAPDQDPR